MSEPNLESYDRYGDWNKYSIPEVPDYDDEAEDMRVENTTHRVGGKLRSRRSKKTRRGKTKSRGKKTRGRRNRKSNKTKRLTKYGGSMRSININYLIYCNGTYKIMQTWPISVDSTIENLAATKYRELFYGTPGNLRSLNSLPQTALVRAALPTYDGVSYNVYIFPPEEELARLCDPNIDPND